MGMIRKVMIETRNRLDGREERDRIIEEQLFDYLPESVERVFIYASVGSEVGTRRIIDRLIADGKQVLCPKVIGRDIYFFPISCYEDLVKGYHDIPEPPVPQDEEIGDVIRKYAVAPEEDGADIVVMPGVTFDEEGGRLGYGAGMYDRFLAKYPVFKIALAYEIQIYYDTLEQDDHDIPMDMIITEKKVREWQQ